MSLNSFGSRSTLQVGDQEYELYRIDALDKQGISTKHLPFSLRILLENQLRTEDGRNVTKEEIRAIAGLPSQKMLHRLRYSLKLLARSRSWRFAVNTLKQRQSSSWATFTTGVSLPNLRLM